MAAAAVLFPSVAAAQSRDPFERDGQSDLSDLLHSDVAGSRQQPGMGENGVRIGSVIVKADAKAVMAGNSNILNRPTNARSDVYVVFEQTARLTTDWTRHQIAVKANAEVARFANSAKQNRETFGAEASGRLDITKRASAFARVAVAQKVERRETPGEANLDGGPAEFKQIEAQVGVRTDEGNLRLTTSAIVTKRIYANIALQGGKTENQDFRDSNTLSINVRADHALPSGAIAFATGTGTRIESPNAGPCCDRSASGGQAMAGMRADLSQLVAAEIALGYSFRNYDASRYKDFGSLIYNARVDWYATPLISLSALAKRNIVTSGIPSVAGIVVSEVGLQVHYEFRRNLIFIFNASVADEKYRDVGVSAKSHLVGAEGNYQFTPRWSAGTFARLRSRSTDDEILVRDFLGFESGIWLKYEL